jgi:hypothetical protein
MERFFLHVSGLQEVISVRSCLDSHEHCLCITVGACGGLFKSVGRGLRVESENRSRALNVCGVISVADDLLCCCVRGVTADGRYTHTTQEDERPQSSFADGWDE